jgi:hypothetical protein
LHVTASLSICAAIESDWPLSAAGPDECAKHDRFNGRAGVRAGRPRVANLDDYAELSMTSMPGFIDMRNMSES